MLTVHTISRNSLKQWKIQNKAIKILWNKNNITSIQNYVIFPKQNVQQEEESSNLFHSAAISEPKSGSILLMKAFFFEADRITSVRIAKKKNTGSENVFLKENEGIKEKKIMSNFSFF